MIWANNEQTRIWLKNIWIMMLWMTLTKWHTEWVARGLHDPFNDRCFEQGRLLLNCTLSKRKKNKNLIKKHIRLMMLWMTLTKQHTELTTLRLSDTFNKQHYEWMMLLLHCTLSEWQMNESLIKACLINDTLNDFD